jgi:tetratricopeptide (TPR) repeat protein
LSSFAVRSAAERLACALVLPALGWGIYCSGRLALADSAFRLSTPESLAEAVRLEPGNAAYDQLLAENLVSVGKDASAEREQAALLSPLDSAYWLDLGAMAEVNSDIPAAERYLLKAASVDRKFAPRWSLMNFYFRQQRPAEFWQWAREAAPMASGDLVGIFRLCRMMTGPGESTDRMLRLPDSARAQYLAFLMKDNHWDAAPAVARAVAAQATSENLALLLDYSDTALAYNVASAVEVWNILLRRKLEPFDPLDAHGGAIVTDGKFRISPIDRVFDWRVTRADGVGVIFGSASPGATVELSGEQDQTVAILTQWMPVEPGRSYRLDYEYTAESENSRQASGVAWEVRDPVTKAVLRTSEDLKASQGNWPGSFEFTATGSAAVLSLRYARTPGTFRHEEKFTIRKLSSRILP